MDGYTARISSCVEYLQSSILENFLYCFLFVLIFVYCKSMRFSSLMARIRTLQYVL
jgi:hypothetical protein